MLLALDQGTTSSRAIVFDDNLLIQASAQKEFQQYYPQSGWVEHDPEEIWNTQYEVACEAIEKAGVPPVQIQSIGITNQRETILLWNRQDGKPLHNAIVWQDRRTSETCRKLREDGHEETIREKTGLVLDPYFSASKIRWLLDNVDGAREAAEEGKLAVGTIDSWLIWNLTKGVDKKHITDATNASRTQLYNIHTGDWDEELLSLWNIPRSLLPEIVDSSGTCAETEVFGKAIPISGIAGDQQSALFGQACFQTGMAKCTYGTGCFILLNIGEKPMHSASRLLTTVAWSINGRLEYALEGSVFMGGATIQWLRDGLGIIQNASEVETLALEVEDTGGVVLVPAFTGLGAPYWDPDARGLLIGMTRGTSRAHIARAALESIASQVSDVAKAMQDDARTKLRELRVDGGASVNNSLMQLQSDLLDVPIVRPSQTESTALGAACLAGLGVGIWESTEQISKVWQADAHFKPQMPNSERQHHFNRWAKAVDRAGNWDKEDQS